MTADLDHRRRAASAPSPTSPAGGRHEPALRLHPRVATAGSGRGAGRPHPRLPRSDEHAGPRGGDPGAQNAEVRAYLDVLSPLAEAEAPSAAPEAAEEPAPPFARPLPTPPEPAPSWQECSCGKRGFLSAKAARLASATNGLRIRVYQCSEDHRLHHVTKSKKVSRRKRKKYRERRGAMKRMIQADRSMEGQ